MIVTINVDDVHPEEGWGLEGDECVEYLEALHKEFGCKFTFFVPSNYHAKFPLSQYQDWINFWKAKDWVELAAHGHLHKAEHNEIEFETLNEITAHLKFELSKEEWDAVGLNPRVFKFPGWICTQGSADSAADFYDTFVIHEQHTNHIEFKNKVIQSHTCITNPYLTFTDTHFQSHINGPNHNNWNQANYNNFRMTLRNLMDVIEVEFKTVGEL